MTDATSTEPQPSFKNAGREVTVRRLIDFGIALGLAGAAYAFRNIPALSIACGAYAITQAICATERGMSFNVKNIAQRFALGATGTVFMWLLVGGPDLDNGRHLVADLKLLTGIKSPPLLTNANDAAQKVADTCPPVDPNKKITVALEDHGKVTVQVVGATYQPPSVVMGDTSSIAATGGATYEMRVAGQVDNENFWTGQHTLLPVNTIAQGAKDGCRPQLAHG